MDLYKQQQFGFFLQTACERFVMRLEERFRGSEAALEMAKNSPGEFAVVANEYTEAVFEDFLLNNVEGACFVLQAFSRRNTQGVGPGGVEAALIEMSKALFIELLTQKSIELLEQHVGYQSV